MIMGEEIGPGGEQPLHHRSISFRFHGGTSPPGPSAGGAGVCEPPGTDAWAYGRQGRDGRVRLES